MTPLSWFGNLSTWLLIAVAWIGAGLIVGLMIGAMARVEEWREGRKGK